MADNKRRYGVGDSLSTKTKHKKWIESSQTRIHIINTKHNYILVHILDERL
jgi:hypothetical protein